MRIIGGTARGRPLQTPSNNDIRPTTDKVRLALFNALFSRRAVTDAVVLDAFCGTGALGCEALSQGAASAVFFDLSKVSLSLARENAEALGFTERSSFFLRDATTTFPRPPEIPPVTLLFLDPPYRKNLVPRAIDALTARGWLAPDAVSVIETEREAEITVPGKTPDFDKSYGDIRLRIFR